jgi:hypothetical protein
MPPSRRPIVHVNKSSARRFWLRAQRLDARMPFGEGPGATAAPAQVRKHRAMAAALNGRYVFTGRGFIEAVQPGIQTRMQPVQIKMARAALGLTVREAAEMTRVSHDTITRLGLWGGRTPRDHGRYAFLADVRL